MKIGGLIEAIEVGAKMRMTNSPERSRFGGTMNRRREEVEGDGDVAREGDGRMNGFRG